MLSYAQNLEDVVLSRLVDLVPAGVYVDVGAGHPILDNVTYALYLAGWRGINVEPMPTEAEMLRAERPGDSTLEVACGAASGVVTLFEAPHENRGATTARADLVARYVDAGQSFRSFDAEVVTLASLLDRYEPGSVHVVKIDVEGMEPEVIAGAELDRTRPWVLVVEATIPNTSDDSSATWEPAVIEAGYTMTLFDGLNRFYVRDDLGDVATLLSVPANVFDRWQRATDARTIEAQRSELVAVRHELERALAEVKRLHDENGQIHASAAEQIGALDHERRSLEGYARSLEAERDLLRAECESLRAGGWRRWRDRERRAGD